MSYLGGVIMIFEVIFGVGVVKREREVMYVRVLQLYIRLFRIVCSDLKALKFGYECDYIWG